MRTANSVDLQAIAPALISNQWRRHRRLICRDLTISAGFSVFTMLAASCLQLASLQSAAFFACGALLANALAIHRVTRT